MKPSLLVLGALTLLWHGSVRAQQDVEDAGYRETLDTARRTLRAGKREAARTIYESVLAAVEEEELEEDKPSAKEQAEALEGLARIERESGSYDKALAKLSQARKKAERPEQALFEARVQALKGEYGKAIEHVLKARAGLDAAAVSGLEAAWFHGWLLLETGKRPDGMKVLAAVEDIGKTKRLEDAEAKLWYAKALIALGGADRLYEASQLLIEATRAEPRLAEAYVARGDLLFDVYRETRGRPSGESEYKRALEHCGENEAALVRMYVTRKENFLLDSSKTDKFLRRALEVNPNSVPALRARASSMIDDRRFESARTLLRRALAINPHDKRTLAEMAAVCHLLYRGDEAKAYRERALEVDPGFVQIDTVLGEHLIALYRFADAVVVLQQAKQKAPDDPGTLLALGRALIYSGDSQAGAAELERTKHLQRGFLNPWRENQLFLQKRLEEQYERVEVGNFVFSIHPSEKGVLLPYLQREYEAAWQRLGTKYGTFPNCKVRVEDFQRFGDFSVRTIGFKGFGALGACFGCFITSVSPAAPELRSQFSWKVTAWHEFAHVLHLQLSKARVPRWLTEGAAVYEEISLHPSFDRRMERQIYSALKNDAVIPLERLNSVFRGSQILLGYYQGGLICRHIAKELGGFEKVVEIITAFGTDKSTAEIFEQVLGMGPKEYDLKFRDYLERLVGSYAIVPTVSEESMNRLLHRVAKDPTDVDARLLLAQGFQQRGNVVDAGQQLAALKRLDPDNGGALLLRGRMAMRRKDLKGARRLLEAGFENGGDDFDSRMLYASILEKAGRRKEAIEQYDAAIRCWPTCSEAGSASPFLNKARLYKAGGDEEAALSAIAEYVRYNGKDYVAHVTLADDYRKKGELHFELRHLERARDIDPFDRRLHERLGELYMQRSKAHEAAFVFRICLAIPAEKDRSRRVARPAEGQQAPVPLRPVPQEDEDVWAARIRVKLAEALKEAGQIEVAREEARKALEARGKLDGDLVDRAEAVLGK